MDTDNYLYIVIAKSCIGMNFITKAVCFGKDQYDAYCKCRDMKDTRTLVVNPNHPKINKFGDFEEIVYDSGYYITDFYEDIPLTFYEEEMLIENETTFHYHVQSKISDIKRTLEKEYLKFSKDEMKDIAKMLDIIKTKNEICINGGEDDDDEYDEWDDPCTRINYKELIIHSGILT